MTTLPEADAEQASFDWLSGLGRELASSSGVFQAPPSGRR